MIRTGRVVLICVGLAGILLMAGVNAQEQGPAATEPAASASPNPDVAGQGNEMDRVGRESLIRLIRQGNPLLWPLAACSIVALGYALERGFALRRKRVIPKDFVDRFLDRLSSGKLDRDRAAELCRANESPVARIFGYALRYWGQPSATIRQALDHDAATELMELKRNVRVLNGTATMAPLLGLLGTVVGMIESFDALGTGQTAGAARSEALANGISIALLATAIGLVIAVISVAFYYYFLQRIDVLARELDDQARQVIDLISAESGRSGTMPSRGPIHNAPELSRLENRPLGRVEPL